MSVSARTAQRRTDAGGLPSRDKEAVLADLTGWFEATWSAFTDKGSDPAALLAFVDEQLAQAPKDRDNMRALALCALKLDCIDAARDLALRSMAEGEPHPRALCIAGLCDLQAGNARSARTLLAQASRLARARPEWRAELHLAQRLLIMTQFR